MKKDKDDKIIDLRDQPDKKLIGDIKVGDKISLEVDFLRHLVVECIEDKGDSKIFLYNNILGEKYYYEVINDAVIVNWNDGFYHLNCLDSGKCQGIIKNVDR